MKFFTWKKTKPKTMIAAAAAVVLAIIRNYYQLANKANDDYDNDHKAASVLSNIMLYFQQEPQSCHDDLYKFYWSTMVNGVTTGVTIVRVVAFVAHIATHMCWQGLFRLAWYLEQVRFAAYHDNNDNDKIMTNDDYATAAAAAACEDLQGLRSKVFADLDATRTLRQIYCHSQLSLLDDDDDGQYHRLGTFVGFGIMTFTLLLIIGWYCGALPNLVAGLWYVHDWFDRRCLAPYRARGPGPWLVHAAAAAAAAAPEQVMTAVEQTCATPSAVVVLLIPSDDCSTGGALVDETNAETAETSDDCSTGGALVDEATAETAETAVVVLIASDDCSTGGAVVDEAAASTAETAETAVVVLIPSDDCSTGGALVDEATATTAGSMSSLKPAVSAQQVPIATTTPYMNSNARRKAARALRFQDRSSLATGASGGDLETPPARPLVPSLQQAAGAMSSLKPAVSAQQEPITTTPFLNSNARRKAARLEQRKARELAQQQQASRTDNQDSTERKHEAAVELKEEPPSGGCQKESFNQRYCCDREPDRLRDALCASPTSSMVPPLLSTDRDPTIGGVRPRQEGMVSQ